MTPLETMLITAQIEALNFNYWLEVDRRDGQNAHSYFVEDGVFTTSLRSRQGRAQIAAFYQGRQAPGPRTARHVVANHLVTVVDAHNASADWMLLLHAADGAPVLPSEPAIMIADVHDVCRLCDDGQWRYVSRTIRAVFKSQTPTTG